MLRGALTVECLRAIESYNFGSPNLVERLSGDYGQRSQRKSLRMLKALGASYFYCGDELVHGRCTHVDHVLPFDYMGNTELWNLVLACQGCNCEKLCSLSPPWYIDKLMARNADHAGDEAMAESLDRMARFGRRIKWHYDNASRHGYRVVKALSAARGQGGSGPRSGEGGAAIAGSAGGAARSEHVGGLRLAGRALRSGR